MAKKIEKVLKSENPTQLSILDAKKSTVPNNIKDLKDFSYRDFFSNDITEHIDPDKFSNIYYFLAFHKIDLFCLLTVDQLAASMEWGYICPIDNKSWDRKILFYPEYDLIATAESMNEPFVFVKVPLSWAQKCEIKAAKNYKDIPYNIEFFSTFDSMFPSSEILDSCINQNHQNEIALLSKTYNLNHNFEAKTHWKTRNEISKIKKIPRLNSASVNKLIGGVVASGIVEIFGILVDCGRIKRTSKYIEPFEGYPLKKNRSNYYFKRTILGPQGFGLLYSLESFIENGTISSLMEIEDRYICKYDYLFKAYDLPKEIYIDLNKSITWLIPVIIKYYEELRDRYTKNFILELKEIFHLNNIKTSEDNIIAAILYAGFSAMAISGNLWDNSQDGISISKKLISELINDASDSLGVGNKLSKSKSIVEFKNLFSKVEDLIKNYDLKAVVNLINTNHMSNFYFDIVFKALAVLWATDTMSKDWYNVFNRAFNGKVKNLSYIFPILGSFMGFFHGYKKINRKKHYSFSNDTYMEILTNNFINKLILAQNIPSPNNAIYIESVSEYEHYNSTMKLSIFKLSNGFELPLLSSNMDQELNKLNYKLSLLDTLSKKIKEKRQLDREIEALLNRASDSQRTK